MLGNLLDKTKLVLYCFNLYSYKYDWFEYFSIILCAEDNQEHLQLYERS